VNHFTDKGHRAIFWSVGVAVGCLLYIVVTKLMGPPVLPVDTFKNIMVKQEILTQLHHDFLRSVEMGKSAVMAITDEASQSFAAQSRAAAQATDQSLTRLHALIDASDLEDEKRLVSEFDACWVEMHKLDQTILELAVQNTNLKAAGLSHGQAAEALQRFESALDELMRSCAKSPNPCQMVTWAYQAATAGLKIHTLHSPHIAEPDDAAMTQIEAQISARKKEVEIALQHLMEFAEAENLQAAGQANAAFGQFMELTANVMHLSRQNSNVKSLELSLGSKRKMVSQCEEVLAALQNAIQSRTFRATR